jgi:hypothetical protein
MNTPPKWPRILRAVAQFLFWGLNFPLAFAVLNGLALSVKFYILQNHWSDLRQVFEFAPTDVLITIGIVALMPIASIISAIFSKSYRKPRKLLQILFGVEVPILAFTIARLIFLKTLTPINILFLSTAVISITAFIFYAFRKPSKNKVVLTLHLLSLQAAVVVGLYASLLMFFFVPIVVAWIITILGAIWKNGLLGEYGYYPSLWDIVTYLASASAFGVLFLSLVGSPFFGLFIYWRAAQRQSKNLEKISQAYFAKLSRWGFSVIYAIVALSLAFQGSLFSFYSQMNSYQTATNFEDRSRIAASILKDESFIRTRLVDTYLAHYRYLTDDGMNLLEMAYKDQVNFKPSVAQNLQSWFKIAAFPFVYRGKFEEDVKKAGEYYEQLFDDPIQIGESDRVRSTLASSFNFTTDQLKSSVLDREDKDVRLLKRTVTAQADSTQQFATVTIEEEYENLKNSDQEVFYIFSLPQDSVMTDLKLGADLELGKESLEGLKTTLPAPSSNPAEIGITPSPKPSSIPPQPIVKKDEATVAAKGAANQTYENQYRPRIDPAILEQVGPAQYKLRVYPIPVKEENLPEWQRDHLTEPVRNQKVRFSYVTMLNNEGKAELPKITEQRNVFSDFHTSFIYRKTNEQTEPLSDQAENIQVLAKKSDSCGNVATEFATNSQTTFFIPHAGNPWMKTDHVPFDCAKGLSGAEQLVKGKRIAVLADSSYSMKLRDWSSYLEKELPLNDLLQTNTVDLYYFNDFVSQPINLNQQRNNPKLLNQVSFGQTDRLKALTSIAGKYDMVLMFTDGNEADKVAAKDFVPSIAQPIYLVSKEGKLPKMPDSLTSYLEVNESQVVNSGTEALQDYAVSQLMRKNFVNFFHYSDPSVIVSDQGTWVTLSTTVTAGELIKILPEVSFEQVSSSDQMAKIAEHRQIEDSMKNLATQLNQLPVLDSLNRQAQENGIVTPFSSFIVLITQQQKEQLRQAALQDGRYTVNYDLGEEQLIQPTAGGLLGTSAVPEPHEWALLLTGAGIILFFGRRRLQALVTTHHV